MISDEKLLVLPFYELAKNHSSVSADCLVPIIGQNDISTSLAKTTASTNPKPKAQLDPVLYFDIDVPQ